MPQPPNREQTLFYATAALQSGAARRAFLDQACTDDSALRARLEARLAAHEDAIVFDSARRQVLTWANAGMRLPNSPESSSDTSSDTFWDLKVWDADSGKPRNSKWNLATSLALMSGSVAPLPTGQTYGVSHFQMVLSPDGSKFASGYEMLVLWDAIEGKLLQPMLRTNKPERSREMTEQLFFSADGRWLWECLSGRARRYDVSTFRPIGEPVSGDYPFISQTGHLFAMQRERGIQLHKMETGESVGPLR